MTQKCQTIDQRWNPTTWKEVVGNGGVKDHLRDLLLAFRSGRTQTGITTLVLGKSRSGKTALVKLFVRCLLCRQLDLNTLNPGCGGTCNSCDSDHARYGEAGVYVYLDDQTVHYLPIDCMQISGAAELRDKVNELYDFTGIRLVYLDEAHRLAHRGLDEILLKPMEELNYCWIATAISAKELDPAVVNRFKVKLNTELPTVSELSSWLAHRCLQWNIAWDNDETIVRIAKRSNCIPGLALQAVTAMSIKQNPLLTRDFVERFQFTAND